MDEDAGNEKLTVKSEAIIADLINGVKSSEKPFSLEKLAGCNETDVLDRKRKKHKHKRHKSKRNKKDKRRRSRSRTYSSPSRSRSRSRSCDRHKSKRRRRKSRSLSRNSNDGVKNGEKQLVTLRSKSPKSPGKETVDNLSNFKKPLPKEDDIDNSPLDSNFQSVVLKKETKMAISITTVLPIMQFKEVEDGEITEIAYGMESRELDTVTSNNAEEESHKKNMNENKTKDEAENEGRNDEVSVKKKKKKSVKTERRRRDDSSSSEKSKSRREKTKTSRHRSESHSRTRRSSRSPQSRRFSPMAIRGVRESRFNRRSISPRRPRNRSNDRDIKRRRGSRDRRDYDNYRRRRSRSREVIDKDKLLAIAKTKRAEMMSNGDREHASIEDFVTYCKKLQKRQEREKRRESGQAVSDHDSDCETIKYKHPYAMPKEPIRINIVNATSMNLAQKALMGPEETTQLDSSQLRIVFPVSSGAVHKENAEWIPIQKDDVPKSCSLEQKKHVALTSLEIDRCRAQGIPVAPAPVPKFLDSVLPPPPPPPQFLPNLSDPFRPSTPPPLPSVLYVPHKEKMIIREPEEIKIPAPKDIGNVLKQRTAAQKKLYSSPNDFEAHRALREANEQIELWAALKSLPGEYTGTTGLKLLTADELQPHNPKFHAWVKRDQFKNAAPATGGIGRLMMEKMGWREGEGLGREKTGNVEPLVLDVKSDRKGLMAEEEMSIKQRNKLNAQNNVPVDLSTKNPISLIMELCAKRRWPAPNFSCEESGQDHTKLFIWTVVVNNVEYRPMCGSRQKKEGKAVAAQVALQSMGVLPRDLDLPVVMY